MGHCKRIAFHSEMSRVWYPKMSRSGLRIPWVLCCKETELGQGRGGEASEETTTLVQEGSGGGLPEGRSAGGGN